jgi:predicted MFS family arabinose efflux permease
MSRKRQEDSLLTPSVLLIVFITFAALVGFQILISVVPLYVERAGGGSTGAGAITAAFMLATVLTQAWMPRLLDRFGYRATLAAGLVLLGPPSLFYALTDDFPLLLAATLPRGAGFGIVTVAFSAMMYELAPPGRRGEALALLGIAIALPTIFCNSLGLWLVDGPGYGAVFVIGGLFPLLGLLAIPGLRATAEPKGSETSGPGFLAGIRRGELLRPFLMFSATTMAAGVVLTFLPLGINATGLMSAATALLVLGVTSTLGRWGAGLYTDRRGVRTLLVPSIAACAVGMTAMPWGGLPTLLGAALFGAGFGALQNVTLLQVMERVPERERGLGSTVWNVSFDAGTGVGALLFGLVISATGFETAFYLSAALVAASVVFVYLDRDEPPGP